MTMILISHELPVVYHFVDRIAVGDIFRGSWWRSGRPKKWFAGRLILYTRALIAAVPPINAIPSRLGNIRGQLQRRMHDDLGCPFRTRCDYAAEDCASGFPEAREIQRDHLVSCWRIGT